MSKPKTIRRAGMQCNNCGGSHRTVSCLYEKKGGGLHNEDGTKIRLCSVCHRPGHTKRHCPELAHFGTHNLPVERVCAAVCVCAVCVCCCVCAAVCVCVCVPVVWLCAVLPVLCCCALLLGVVPAVLCCPAACVCVLWRLRSCCAVRAPVCVLPVCCVRMAACCCCMVCVLPCLCAALLRCDCCLLLPAVLCPCVPCCPVCVLLCCVPVCCLLAPVCVCVCVCCDARRGAAGRPAETRAADEAHSRPVNMYCRHDMHTRLRPARCSWCLLWRRPSAQVRLRGAGRVDGDALARAPG